MKTLQISTPFLPVSPRLTYGGTERIVYMLDNELMKKGHDSFVAAPKTSEPVGILLPTVERDCGVGFVLDKEAGSEFLGLNLRLEHIARALKIAEEGDFDVVHAHDDNIFPFMPLIKQPSLLTLHSDCERGFWNLKFHPNLATENTDLVSISQHQKRTYEKAGFKVKHVVYNGIDTGLYDIAKDRLNNFLLTLGGIMPQKGQHIAIQVGKKTGIDILVAGNVGNAGYFREKIQPEITHDLSKTTNPFEEYRTLPASGHKVVYLGPVNDLQKKGLYQHAQAFLMPIEWDEPFGLVIVEAMASGTPVIAFDRGSVPEIVENGRNGYVVSDIAEMIRAISSLGSIRPETCRQDVIEKFSKERMARDYEEIYREVAGL